MKCAISGREISESMRVVCLLGDPVGSYPTPDDLGEMGVDICTPTNPCSDKYRDVHRAILGGYGEDLISIEAVTHQHIGPKPAGLEVLGR